ncbi:hypothetical protein [Winogradskyella sp.]|uniref:hypothetical protein n=1 Tax=Winogradskyella sp. TaxID=1883156 RepID=UPI0025D9E19D|nr:hypothetical protein [Winogradskyella sp.]MBT8245203.1 hypothetical protein [Winogradskyella sp.]
MLSLTLLGIIQQYQEPKVNQEIILEFTDLDFTSVESQESLQVISTTLLELGAKNISVVSIEDGTFKIVYHSNISAFKIEKILSEKAEITFGIESNKNPKENKTYSFDVFQINKGHTPSWDFEGQQVVTLNLKSDRLFQPKILKFGSLSQEWNIQFNLTSKCKTNKSYVFDSDNTSYKIQETRAGPQA